MQTTEFDEEDEDVDLRTSGTASEAIIVGGGHSGGHSGSKQTTYLVDHHPQLFEHPPSSSLTNYATMPRQPSLQQPPVVPPLTSTFSHHQANTMGRQPRSQ